jgi:hypothetical protein
MEMRSYIFMMRSREYVEASPSSSKSDHQFDT